MKHIQTFEGFSDNLSEKVNEAKSYDIPGFGNLSIQGKKLTVDFYNLDDWDSSMYGGGTGRGQAMKDIKMAAKGENDPLLDDIEMHLNNFGLGSINWDKPIKVTGGGSSLEFVLESYTYKEVVLSNNFSQDIHLNEERLMGRQLKAQKFIDLCIIVAKKAKSKPEEVRSAVIDHTLSYDSLKKITDAINRI